MPAINILLKPASSACNMNCAYCFYKDVAANRETAFQGMLSLERMEQVIAAGMEYAEGICSFAFQGGEPTLAGLDFYKSVVELQKKYAKPGIIIHNAIQTNGYCVDEEWADFFGKNHFLVGLSLDGPADLHNLNRKDFSGKGTFNRILRAAKLFDRYRVDYNILCVVTGKNARAIGQIYSFYKKQGFRWLQFIPCLEPLDQVRGQEKYHLSCQEYGAFLVRIFDLWFADLRGGNYISIRHLDNWIGILLGERPEACNMAGCCSVQFVVEGDGGVYPCDFYVLDQWRMGTVGEQTLAEMQDGETAKKFVDASLRVPESCRHCDIYGICRNGCRRERTILENGLVDQNYYCDAYRAFFTARGHELKQAAQLIWNMRRP